MSTTLALALFQRIHLSLQFHQPASAYVEFDFLIARGASIGVYGRKNAVPTLTQNDLREVISGVRARNGRDANDISGNQVGTCIRSTHSRVIKLTIYLKGILGRKGCLWDSPITVLKTSFTSQFVTL